MAQDNSNPQQGASFLHTGRRGPPPHRRDDRKLFVGGLPANITSEEFEEFFGQFGKLVDSVVMFDRETQRSRGFGFVTYQDPKVCQKLLLMGNQDADPSTAMSLVGRIEMQGKVCEIKAATPRETTIRPRNDESKRTPTTADSANTMSGPRLTRPAVDGYGYPPTSTNMTFAPTMVPPPLIYYPPPYATPHGYTSFVPYPPQQPGYATFPDFPPLYTAENAAPPPPIMTHQYPVLGIPSHPAPTPVLPAAMITLPAPAVVALVDPHLPPSTSLGHSNNSNKDNMIPTGASHSDISVSLPHPLVPLPPPPPVSANVDSSSAENTNPTATAMPTFHATTATSSLSFYPPFHHQDPTFAMAPFAAPQSHKNDSKLKDVEGTDPQLPYQSLESR